MEIVGSYVSILTRLLARYDLKERFYFTFLFLVQKILMKYQKLRKMLEDENEGIGIDAFDPDSIDP